MSIVLDAMGSDNHPLPELQAASQLAQIGEKVILVGKKDFILQKSREIGEAIGRELADDLRHPFAFKLEDSEGVAVAQHAVGFIAVESDGIPIDFNAKVCADAAQRCLGCRGGASPD